MASGSWIPRILVGVFGGLCVACTGLVHDPDSAAPSDGGLLNPPGSAATGGSTNPPGGAGQAGGSAQAGRGGSTSAPVETAAVSSAYPRLSHRQWALAAQDLLALERTPDVSGFSADAPAATGFDNTTDRLEVSQGLWTDYQTASEGLAADVAGSPDKLAKITPAGLPGSDPERARAFVTSLGERAFRRPLTSEETSEFAALFQAGPSLYAGRDALSAGAEVTIQALLQAPAFVYRIENANPPDATGVAKLSDYEVAARLSFMLWDSLPDQQLMAAAKAGELHTAEQIATQAERMLDSARAKDKLLDFHRQLLELSHYDTLRPQGLPADIGPALRTETERFVRAAVIDQPGSFAELFRANYSFVNSAVAEVYGLSGDFGDDFVRTDLDPEQRAGLLTQPGFLISRSGDTAPILRGVFINLKILCADLPPPPVFTPPRMTGTTRRERINSVTGAGTCGAGCHAGLINPAGFPLEYFDDLGRYRRQDNGKTVDGSASYAFSDGQQTFDGPIEWSQAIASSEQAHACYVKHWLEYGLGRGYTKDDAPLVQRLAAKSLADDLPVKELLTLLVQSPSFSTRRSEAP
ncbi:MAG: DUF1592 domain-containing protein [Polyangiales bacterium]